MITLEQLQVQQDCCYIVAQRLSAERNLLEQLKSSYCAVHAKYKPGRVLILKGHKGFNRVIVRRVEVDIIQGIQYIVSNSDGSPKHSLLVNEEHLSELPSVADYFEPQI